MDHVRPKKKLGQHFLRDENIARKIANSIRLNPSGTQILEIGPGTGILTEALLALNSSNVRVIEIDPESVVYLRKNFSALDGRILEGDFLSWDISKIFSGKFIIAGNFPYNISSQILFRVLEEKDRVEQVVGMFQKEVAKRIASPPGNKEYGILSVLLRAYYSIEYLFSVNENVFLPPPKVKSAVIRLLRNQVSRLSCDEKLFKTVVKTAFNQRRKTLRNALRKLMDENKVEVSRVPFLEKRAEQLSPDDFIQLTSAIESFRGK